MPKCSVSEWGEYLGDQHGLSRFYTYDSQKFVTYKKSLAKELKVGSKVVVTIQYMSKKSSGTVVQVHDPQSVIYGIGTVACADLDFGFIRFDHQHQPGLAVFFSENFEHPKSRCGTRLDSLVSVGSLVQFDAIPNDPKQSNRKHNISAQYCAVRVNLVETDPAPASAARVLKDQQGIIVQIVRDRSLFIRSKELGAVYAPKTNLEGDRNHDLQVGQWLEFAAREQEQPVNSTHWCVIKARRFDNQLKFETTPLHSRGHTFLFLKLIDCIGVLTNVWDTQGLLWSPQLGRVVLLKGATRGWSLEFKPGTLIIFDAKQIRPFEGKEDICWQATTMKSGQGAVDNISDSIRRCRAELIEVTGPSSGLLYNEEMGRISFTAMDLNPHVTAGAQFRNVLKEHKCFDVRFVEGFSHWPVKWCAVYVGILKPQAEVPQQQVLDHASEEEEDTFAEKLDAQLDEILQSEQDQSSGIELYLTTSAHGLETPEMKDAECQTEPLTELALFQLICGTPSLLSVMEKNHKNHILVMRQLVRNKFIPNYHGAKVQCESASSLMQRNVSCQTAASPESGLANRLINDQEIFSLVMDIDQNLLMSIP